MIIQSYYNSNQNGCLVLFYQCKFPYFFLTFKDLNGQNSSKILIPCSKYSKESKACDDYADRSMRIG